MARLSTPVHKRLLTFVFALPMAAGLPAQAATLVASVLPTSRSVQVDAPATLFVSMVNAGPDAGVNCRIAADSRVSGAFSFQTTDPATNTPVGVANAAVDIGVGGLQTFVVTLTPDAELAPTEVNLGFLCDNAQPVEALPGINTFTFSAASGPVADVVALGATPSGDGVVELPEVNPINAFSVASVNLGSDAALRVRADLSDSGLPATISLCETDPATAQCINPAAPVAGPVTTSVTSGAAPTFGVFVSGVGTVPFDPARNRVFVRFEDATGAVRGSTSVALRSETVVPFDQADLIGNTLWSDPAAPGQLPGIVDGVLFRADGSGTSYENAIGFRSGQAFSDVSEDFSWSISDGRLQQVFADFDTSIVVGLFGNYDALVTEYGLPQAVADFFQQRWDAGLLGTELELERRLVDRTSRVLGVDDGKLQVLSSSRERFSMDAELTRNGWSEALPQGALITRDADRVLFPAPLLSDAAGVAPEVGSTWTVPFVYSPQDPLVSDQPASYVVDALTLQAGGNTSVGRLSNRSFAWSAESGRLVLSAANETHRLLPVMRQGDHAMALAEYLIDGQPAFVSGQWIVISGQSPADLAADLLGSGTRIWQAGLNIWQQSAYRADGLLEPENVFGYQFPDAIGADRVFGRGAAECGGGQSCFVREGEPLWTWQSSGRLITRTRTSGTTTRHRTWEVLSYTSSSRALVLESAVWEFEGSGARFVIPPRVNTLDALDLSRYPAQLANSAGF